MDADLTRMVETLAARAASSRTITVEIEPARYQIMVPSRYAAHVAWLRAGTDRAAPVVAERALLEQALIGWDGVTSGMIAEDDSAELVPWHPKAVPLLLDANPDVERELSAKLDVAYTERMRRIQAAEKN
jgi:hypothetical protein